MMSQSHKERHPILEVIHRSEKTVSKVDQRLSQVDLGNTAIRAVAGTHAFRDYNWLTNVAATNAAGNLRGMVVSAKWRVAFRYSSQIGEYVENIGLLAGFAAGIAEAERELERLANSNEPAALKGMCFAANRRHGCPEDPRWRGSGWHAPDLQVTTGLAHDGGSRGWKIRVRRQSVYCHSATSG
jgi:hypothetical protein